MRFTKKQIVIFTLAAVLLLVIVGAILLFAKPSITGSSSDQTVSQRPTDTELVSLMSGVVDNPNNVTVTDVKEPSTGWFVVRIIPSDGAGDPALVLFNRSNSGILSLIDGPSTGFDSDVLTNRGVPKVVRDALVGS